MRGVPVKDFQSYFWSKVIVKGKDDCWLWTGTTVRGGYGSVGEWKRHNVSRFAHRISYQYEHGQIPDGLFVLHKCDVPGCVNPNHLFLGTKKDNALDCVAKGRKPRGKEHSERVKANSTKGELNKHAKLTEEDVLSIREDSRTLKEIAKSYGVRLNHVWRIKKKLSWSHV